MSLNCFLAHAEMLNRHDKDVREKGTLPEGLVSTYHTWTEACCREGLEFSASTATHAYQTLLHFGDHCLSGRVQFERCIHKQWHLIQPFDYPCLWQFLFTPSVFSRGGSAILLH